MPLGYRSDNGTRDEEFDLAPRESSSKSSPAPGTEVSALTRLPKEEENKYYRIVATLSPKEMIGRFARTAPPRVQEAARQTILGLLGSAGSFAVETNTITTSERLANLMFQLQMTGYMFKNADYRISLAQSLDGGGALLGGSSIVVGPADPGFADLALANGDDNNGKPNEAQHKTMSLAVARAPLPDVRGTVKVSMPGGRQVEVDADAYMTELRGEVEALKRELDKVEEDKRASTQKDLLAYVRSMPEQQLATLTSDVTEEVLDGMKKLVYSIMRSMGTANIQPGTVLQQSGAAMAQLCMWQLVIGYNLRELEVRDQLQKQVLAPLPPPPPPSAADGA